MNLQRVQKDEENMLHAVITVFIKRRKIEIAGLYEEPFTRFGENPVEKLFSEEEM